MVFLKKDNILSLQINGKLEQGANSYPGLKFPWLFVVILVIGITVTSIISLCHNHGKSINSDGIGYSSYLRLYLIHHGLDFEQLIKHEQPYGLSRSPQTGKLASQYPVGTAIAQLPFFFIGHVVAKSGKWPADGWSAPYQWSVFFAALFWFCIGIAAAWVVIATRTNQISASFALIAVTFGTNLLHYVVNEPSMSHIYAFGVFASTLFLSYLFWRSPSTGKALAFGLLLGLLVSIRNYNILFAPLVLYPALLRINWKTVFSFWYVFGVGAFLGLLPHFILVTYYLGMPWANTYWTASLNWLNPKLSIVLFSVRKGWFFWTPIAAIGVLGLLYGIRTKLRWFCTTAIIGIAGVAYIVSVWVDPVMGHSFGHRAFVDALPLVALGIAIISRSRIIKIVIVILIILNLYLTGMYWKGYIPPDGTKMKTYLQVVQMPFKKLFGISVKQDGKDSSKRDGLSAHVQVIEAQRNKSFLVVTAMIRNTGTALWLSDPGMGTVYMAVRPFDNFFCTGAASWEWREKIPYDNPPGGEMVLTARIPASFITKPFRYACVEMMSEPVVWFRDLGSEPYAVSLPSDMTLPWLSN